MVKGENMKARKMMTAVIFVICSALLAGCMNITPDAKTAELNGKELNVYGITYPIIAPEKKSLTIDGIEYVAMTGAERGWESWGIAEIIGLADYGRKEFAYIWAPMNRTQESFLRIAIPRGGDSYLYRNKKIAPLPMSAETIGAIEYISTEKSERTGGFSATMEHKTRIEDKELNQLLIDDMKNGEKSTYVNRDEWGETGKDKFHEVGYLFFVCKDYPELTYLIRLYQTTEGRYFVFFHWAENEEMYISDEVAQRIIECEK